MPAAEVEVGERLFLETRFAQFVFAQGGANLNAPLKKGDPVLAKLAVAKLGPSNVRGPFAGQAMNCAACHLNEELKGRRGLPGRGVENFADLARRSLVMATNSAPRAVSNQLILAMIDMKLGRPEAARIVLADLRSQVDQWSQGPFQIVNADGTRWYNQGAVRILLREAEKMAAANGG